jgi:serine phosphatase RsbU (regulator of sigma subunit)
VLHAVTVMAELRHAVRAYAVEGHPPGAVLELVNRFMRTVLPAESATLCLLTPEPGTGRVRMAGAGHLPPLLHAPASVGSGYASPRTSRVQAVAKASSFQAS